MAAAPTAPVEPQALCELRHVDKEFPQGERAVLRVLEEVSLAVYPREVVALLGPSGCGKSTILRILAGLTTATGGEVLYHGARLAGLNPGVGFVFQGFALFPWMTVSENVEAALWARGLGSAEVDERAARAIRAVGLAGFEEAYPRELSGGMKQRVGIARAFSVDPEMLFMDEPFSQVDALTAESLRSEVLDLWTPKDRNPSSILMVSHDIKEVVYMADRIVVLGSHPGTVRTIVLNALKRPRDYRSPELLALVDRLHDIITGSLLPDVPAPLPAPARPLIEPLPPVSSSEIVGLIEYLAARGGREDLFRIATDTNREFGELIRVVEAAELLDFVDTPKRTVVLEPLGMRLAAATLGERKTLWAEQLLKLGLYQHVRSAILRSDPPQVSREFVLETLAIALPAEDFEKTFETFVRWARFGDVLDYDEATETLKLPA